MGINCRQECRLAMIYVHLHSQISAVYLPNLTFDMSLPCVVSIGPRGRDEWLVLKAVSLCRIAM
jgi:hypothetical protein